MEACKGSEECAKNPGFHTCICKNGNQSLSRRGVRQFCKKFLWRHGETPPGYPCLCRSKLSASRRQAFQVRLPHKTNPSRSLSRLQAGGFPLLSLAEEHPRYKSVVPWISKAAHDWKCGILLLFSFWTSGKSEVTKGYFKTLNNIHDYVFRTQLLCFFVE